MSTLVTADVVVRRQPHLSGLARGAILNGAAFAGGSLASFAATIVVARLLGPDRAGFYFQNVALVSIACCVATCGAEPGLIRALSRLLALDEGRLVRPILTIGLLPVFVVSVGAMVLIEVFAASLVHSLAGGSSHAALLSLRVVAVAVPFWALERVLTAAGRGLGSSGATALIDGFTQQCLRFVLIGAAAVTIPSLMTFAIAWALPALVAAVAAGWWTRRLIARLGPTGSVRGDGVTDLRARASEFWGFAVPRGFAYAFQVSTLWIGVLLASWFGSARDAGVFGSLSRAAVVGTLALQSINLVIEPRLAAALARNERQTARDLYQTATRWAVTAGFPLFICLGLYSRAFLGVFGDEFTIGATALTIVSGAMLWNVLTGPVTAVLLMAGRSVWNLWNAAAALAVYVAAGVILIPRFGLIGVAVAWSAAIVVENGLPLFQVYRGLGLQPLSKRTVYAGLAAVVCFGAAGAAFRAVEGNTVGASVAAFAVGLLPYALYLRRSGASHIGC